MSITAVVEEGLIKLPQDVAWASGTVVRIEPVEEPPRPSTESISEKRPSFKEHLLSMPDVGEDWMFDRHDPRNALPARKPFDFVD